MTHRIASLLPSATEIVVALGLEPALVGVSHECDFPARVKHLPRLTESEIDSTQPSAIIDQQVRERLAAGLTLYRLNERLLTKLAPDLIITQAQCDVCAIRYAEVLEFAGTKLNLPASRVLALNPLALADLFADIRRIGAVTERQSEAEQFVASLQQRLQDVTDTVAKSSLSTPRVVCLEWLAPFMPAGNWTPELITHAGGISGLATGGEHSVVCEWKSVCEYNPDVLLIAPCGFDLARSQAEAVGLRELPSWTQLAAVQNDRVFILDGNAYLNRSGPRLIETIELLAHLFHPDVVPPPADPLAFARYGASV